MGCELVGNAISAVIDAIVVRRSRDDEKTEMRNNCNIAMRPAEHCNATSLALVSDRHDTVTQSAPYEESGKNQ